MVLVLALGFIPTLGITASAADEYTVSYSTPAGVTAPAAETVAAGESVTLPTVGAAKEGYTTRIPFIASKEIREAAREVFF